MNDQEFKDQVLNALQIKDLAKDEQDALLVKLELLANTRMTTALPELLNEEQYGTIEEMKKSGKSVDEILDWVESQLPSYKEMRRALILDIADELNRTQPS